MFPSDKIATSAKLAQFLRPEGEGLPQYLNSLMDVGHKTKAILVSFNASTSVLCGKDAVIYRRRITLFRITITLYFPSQQPVNVSRRKRAVS